MHGAALPIRSTLGFRVLLKDTSAHGLGGIGDRTANLAINRQPSLPPEPQPLSTNHKHVVYAAWRLSVGLGFQASGVVKKRGGTWDFIVQMFSPLMHRTDDDMFLMNNRYLCYVRLKIASANEVEKMSLNGKNLCLGGNGWRS